jgi:hypothetical protein
MGRQTICSAAAIGTSGGEAAHGLSGGRIGLAAQAASGLIIAKVFEPVDEALGLRGFGIDVSLRGWPARQKKGRFK